jgi:acyl-CoA thioester hydrolase
MQTAIELARASTTIEIRVRFCETDLMKIVHHATYFTYFEAGRVEWLRRRGATYARWAAGGLHWPVVEAEARYKAPARFDDLVMLRTTLTELRAYSLRFDYALELDGRPLVLGSTRLACINDDGKLEKFNADMCSVLASAELA